jgi:hypothetical protein
VVQELHLALEITAFQEMFPALRITDGSGAVLCSRDYSWFGSCNYALEITVGSVAATML